MQHLFQNGSFFFITLHMQLLFGTLDISSPPCVSGERCLRPFNSHVIVPPWARKCDSRQLSSLVSSSNRHLSLRVQLMQNGLLSITLSISLKDLSNMQAPWVPINVETPYGRKEGELTKFTHCRTFKGSDIMMLVLAWHNYVTAE